MNAKPPSWGRRVLGVAIGTSLGLFVAAVAWFANQFHQFGHPGGDHYYWNFTEQIAVVAGITLGGGAIGWCIEWLISKRRR